MHELTASSLSVLYDKVEAADLPDQVKDDIMETMDNLSVQQETALEVSAKPSSLRNLPPYLTTGDGQKSKQSHLLDSMRIICERLKKLGIRKLKEDTKKTAIAALLHVHVTVHKRPLPCSWSIYGLADDFVQCFAHTEAGTTVAPLKLYPTSPNGLQRDWVKQSYGDEEPSMSSLTLAAVYPKIPLRSTSTLLQCERPANLKHLNKSVSSSSVGSDRLVEKLEDFMDRFNPLSDSQHLHSGKKRLAPAASSALAVPLQNIAGAATVLPLANMHSCYFTGFAWAPVVPNNGAVVPVESSAAATGPATSGAVDKPCVEDFEEKAFNVLTERKAMAKQKAKAKCNAKKAATAKKETALKRPAASGKKTNVENKIYGCSRCRGNVKGCSTCWNPSYNGIRFSSREQWAEYHRTLWLKKAGTSKTW